ncbi:unnamed protein product [Rotaria magnacalcarata]|uniref:Uncharacterized protein n=1 Tax=Rotaria magnacalcarata TaxID=392030 RepID=A0A815TFY8_9BILA|nr:unnamed protein product [Rotaria magnacalcarata]CAF5164394.1 unnamed protein product [Rotaria magnacalcarata]
MAFDLDVIQICFNGEKVLSTWTFIRALNTGTFICYNLTNDVVRLGRSAVRIGKYYQKTSNYYILISFKSTTFLSLMLYQLRHMQHPDYYLSTQEQFGNNHDYFQLQQNFVQMRDCLYKIQFMNPC